MGDLEKKLMDERQAKNGADYSDQSSRCSADAALFR